MRLPSLVIAGAQKAGTSSLATTLHGHPQIQMARKPKETHFFDRHFDLGLEWYASQFNPNRTHVHLGDATPVYMYDQQARERLAQTLPDAKILISLRDPIERAYSHYWHQRRRGNEKRGSFERAVTREQRRISRGDPVKARYSYLARGHYLDQVLAMVEGHGRERVHVILFEDLISDRVATLHEIFTFLEVDVSQAERLPEQWTNRYRVTDDSGETRPAQYPPIDPGIRAQLVEHFHEDNDRLAAWLDRDLSAWNRP